MKRSQNTIYSVSALALFALLGLTACPQDGKEEVKSAPVEPAAAPAQPPAATPTTEPGSAAPSALPAPAVVAPAAAPATGEALKPDPSKAAPVEAKEPAKK